MSDSILHVVYTGTRQPDFERDDMLVYHVPMLEPHCLKIDIAEFKRRTKGKDSTFVFYSKNAVDCVAAQGILDAPPVSVRCWAVGTRTAHHLNTALGCEVFVPEQENFEGLLTTMPSVIPDDGIVVSFELADSERRLEDALADRSLEVFSIPTYETRPKPYRGLDGTVAALAPDWLVFTSPRGFEAFLVNTGEDALSTNEDGFRFGNTSKRVRLAAIGETTASSMRDHGFPPDYVPERPDVREMLDALVAP